MAKPCRLEGEEGFIYYHLPVTGGGDTPKSPDAVAGTYLAMLDEQMDKIIHTIMDAKSNVLYFCGAGKDRTGVVSAIILKKLGCSDQIIIEDYMETKGNLHLYEKIGYHQTGRIDKINERMDIVFYEKDWGGESDGI